MYDSRLAKGAQKTREEAEPQRGAGVHLLARVLNRRTLPCPSLRAPSLKAVHAVLNSYENRHLRHVGVLPQKSCQAGTFEAKPAPRVHQTRR